MATITNLNAHALMNTALEVINTLRTDKKATIAKMVNHWNLCVEQSGFTTVYDFPVEGWTRKAQVIADLERCAAQLKERAFAPVNDSQSESIVLDSVAINVELVEVVVVDIEVGMSVQVPTDTTKFQTVEKKVQYGDYVVIQFSGYMGTQSFDCGETLMVVDSVATDNDPAHKEPSSKSRLAGLAKKCAFQIAALTMVVGLTGCALTPEQQAQAANYLNQYNTEQIMIAEQQQVKIHSPVSTTCTESPLGGSFTCTTY